MLDKPLYFNYCLPQNKLDDLENLLKNVVEFLNYNSVNYWVDGGTMLCMSLGNEQIPNDDDIDLGIEEKDFMKLVSNCYQLFRFGYSLRECDGYLKITDENKLVMRNEISGQIFHKACIDIFYYRKNNNNIYELASESYRQKYPNAKIKKTDLYPLITAKYNNKIVVNVPRKPNDYLNGSYPLWRDLIIVDMRIGNNKENQKVIFNRSDKKFLCFYDKDKDGELKDYLKVFTICF